jgi:hypothetical protein
MQGEEACIVSEVGTGKELGRAIVPASCNGCEDHDEAGEGRVLQLRPRHHTMIRGAWRWEGRIPCVGCGKAMLFASKWREGDMKQPVRRGRYL